MLQFSVDDSLCTRCGQCAGDCISAIIKQEGSNLPSIAADDEAQCLRCQHCLAVCPAGAISIFGKSAKNSLPILPGSYPSFDQLAHLVRGRRSIRHYKQENVDPELLNKLLTTLANVQTGANASQLTFTVIDDVATMKRFQQQMMSVIRSSATNGSLPERYKAMLDLPDEILVARLFRSAPHVLVVSTPPTVTCPNEDVALAIATFELLAQSAGLGSVWWGFMRLFTAMVPGIKPLLGIPEEHVTSAALFGYPAIQFARTVQRDEAAVIKRLTL